MAEKDKSEKKKPAFDVEKQLSDSERKDFEFAKLRITQLQEFRQQKQYGTDIEQVWVDADKDYAPHRLKTKGKRVIAEDENLGWRGVLVTLGSQDWQSDISQPNPFIKIQTALSILIDQNPVGVFTPSSKKFSATTELMRQLYQRSWEYAKSKQQLKLFVYNLAKYGWATARTYPLRITRKVKILNEYDPENPDNNKYEEKETTVYNDIMRENLDPWNVWMDDMAKPNNALSVRDWVYRKVYAKDSFDEEFGKFTNAKFVVANAGVTSEKVTTKSTPEKKFKENNLVEVFFYENIMKDLYLVIANGVPVVIEPLPISDAKGNKKLSLWQTYWNLRHAESPYGIGIYEAIRYDQALIDRLRNMTIDQLTLSIYKSFFYQGTQALTETGEIRLSPGTGKQVLDPKNINWVDVPGPGAESWKGLEVFRKDLDEASGITETLTGTITGKTAFEIAQAKEAALKRLRSPLDNITDALDSEAYITISLVQLLYSLPETYEISDPDLIADYLKEIESDPDLYEREGDAFRAHVYPEFPMNLSTDEKGNLVQTNETQFFRVKPKFLKWEGIVNVKSQSVLTPSKQVDKALELEMYNMLIPLLSNPPVIYSKIARSIVKLYDKDPKDILPDDWLQADASPQQQKNNALIVPAAQLQSTGIQQAPINQGTQGVSPPGGPAPTLVSKTQFPARPSGLGPRIVSQSIKPIRNT